MRNGWLFVIALLIGIGAHALLVLLVAAPAGQVIRGATHPLVRLIWTSLTHLLSDETIEPLVRRVVHGGVGEWKDLAMTVHPQRFVREAVRCLHP